MEIVMSILRALTAGVCSVALYALWTVAEVALYGISQHSILTVVVCVIIGSMIGQRIWR